MPARTRIYEAAQKLVRHPRIEAMALAALDLWCPLALSPFRRPRRVGSAAEREDLVASTDQYNRAAEGYYANFAAPAFLLNKPFSDAAALPKHLIDAGILLAAARVAPGDVVLELGAGSCWLSHIFNRYGCRTLSVDVSPTALALGRQVFESDARTNWAVEPQFLVYDGHRLPVGDATCDAIVINDAFHHVPNQRELLGEMHRVLRPDGIVAMSEPGRGHSATDRSTQDTREWGVLENELVIEDVAALARDCGFAEVKLIVSSPSVQTEIDAGELGAFMGGKGFARHWKAFCSALEVHRYIVCAKTAARTTTKRPGLVVARIDLLWPGPQRGERNVPTRLTFRISNAGNTVWLGGETPRGGWTRLGAHLYRGSDRRELVDFDWWRHPLPAEISPGETVTLEAALPPIAAAGAYVVVFDLVIEGMAWFADLGSSPFALDVDVRDTPS